MVITGDIAAVDPDGDPLTYTVVGRPLNGGTVVIDEDGDFTYRPMNAMAAVGGTDSFTVVVNDKAAGLHVHGPLGLPQFVPILGNFLNPGGGHGVARTITVTVKPVEGIDLSFPEGFHWGVAHSGFQAEGGPGSPVDPNSDWYRWVHNPINQSLGLTNGVPENGPGTYVMYDSDAQLARDQLGMNTFRTSIEWSRIFPNSTAAVDISDEGGTVSLADLQALDALANQDEVAHYRAVFDSLRAHGLEPLITVNHFTLPVWVHDPITARPLVQLGLPAPAAGWLSPATPVEFEKYAAYVAWKYGDQVDNWTVLNEPVPPILTQFLAVPVPGSPIPYWPPGVIRPDLASTFLVNEAKGYVAAYDTIHAWDTTVATPGQPAAFVGFANNMIPARPANPVNPLDVQAAAAWNNLLQPLVPQRGDRRMGGREPGRGQDIRRDPPRDGRQSRFHRGAVLRVATDAGLWPRAHSGTSVAARPAGPVRGRLPDVQRLQPTHRPGWIPRGPRRRGLVRKAPVDHREWHRRRQRFETAVIHRQPHRGRAGPNRARHGYPRLHVLVLRRQPRVGGRLPPSVRALRVGSHNARARAHAEAGQHLDHQPDHGVEFPARESVGDEYPEHRLSRSSP